MDKSTQEEFITLLKKQLKAFSQYKKVQKRIQKALEILDTSEIRECEREQKILDAQIKSIRADLVFYLEKWKCLDKKIRTELLNTELGTILEEIDRIAMDVNTFHEENYSKKSITDIEKKAECRSISSIINLYR